MAKISPIQTKNLKHKSTRLQIVESKMEKCIMYNCLRKTMRVSRWFGFFPVEGLESASISSLRYNMRSIYSIFTILTIMGLVTMMCITLNEFVNHELSITRLSYIVFYASSFISGSKMVILAKRWPYLMKDISDIEKNLSLHLDKNISRKIVGFGYAVLFFGFVDYFLSVIYIFRIVMICSQDFTLSYSVMYKYFTFKLSHFLENRLNFVTGILVEIANVQATFMRTFVDVIVISASLYLINLLKKFNRLIELQKNYKTTDWELLRIKFSNLVVLVNKIDGHLSLFVFISISVNLFFTCLQLFKTLRDTESTYVLCDPLGSREAHESLEYKLYYSFSFVFVITRTFVVSMLAADVNFWACEPVFALGEIHASAYNIEIQRFYRQLTYTTVGISGVFFYVTRKMILKVLGTFVTYELMMLQLKHLNGSETMLYNNSSGTT